MLDRFQRSSVEVVREHQGKFNIVLDDPKHTVVSRPSQTRGYRKI